MILRILLFFIFIFLISPSVHSMDSLREIGYRKIVRRDKQGPYAIMLWGYRSYPYKTQDEIDQYKKELQAKINDYMARHPEIEYPLSYYLKESKAIIEGANKEQTELLYGKPDIMTAVSYELSYGADEKWVYKSHGGEDRIYFKNEKVVAIECLYYDKIIP